MLVQADDKPIGEKGSAMNSDEISKDLPPAIVNGPINISVSPNASFVMSSINVRGGKLSSFAKRPIKRLDSGKFFEKPCECAPADSEQA